MSINILCLDLLYQKYKKQEAELNILILEINSKLKQITKKEKILKKVQNK